MKTHSNVDEVPVDELWKCFSSALSAMEKVYCVIDALDEMESGHDLFLADLINLGRRSPRSIKLALTSRQLPHLEAYLKGSCLVDLRLDRKNVDKDIAIYISHRLKHCQIPLTEDQSRGIEEAICDKGKGLFLYARLMMDQCLQDPAHFITQLDKLPEGLGDMYTDLLREHAARSGTNQEFQRLVLGWITHSTRPLRLLELTAVINLTEPLTPRRPLQETKMMIRTCCGPLLELCEDQVIQIIHHSFTEFLLDPEQHHVQMTSQDLERFPILDPTRAHWEIARASLAYLDRSKCFDEWEVLPRADLIFERDNESEAPLDRHTKVHKELLVRFPFLDYAARNWPFHAEKVTAGEWDQLNSAVFCLLQDGTHNFESWKDFWQGLKSPLPENFSPFHVAAHCGLTAYVERLLHQGADPNVTDSFQRMPTTYAAMEGHDLTLKVLIEHGASFQDSDMRGLAPIHHAAMRNQPATLRVLLDQGAHPLISKCAVDPGEHYGKISIGNTPLFYACQYGHVEALRELLRHLEPSQLLHGPLHWAADYGRAEILTVLLQYPEVRVHINDKDENGK